MECICGDKFGVDEVVIDFIEVIVGIYYFVVFGELNYCVVIVVSVVYLCENVLLLLKGVDFNIVDN